MATRISKTDPRAQVAFMLVVLLLATAVWTLAVQARSVVTPGTRPVREGAVVWGGATTAVPSRPVVGFHHGQVRVGRLPWGKAPQVRPHDPRHRPKYGP